MGVKVPVRTRGAQVPWIHEPGIGGAVLRSTVARGTGIA